MKTTFVTTHAFLNVMFRVEEEGWDDEKVSNNTQSSFLKSLAILFCFLFTLNVHAAIFKQDKAALARGVRLYMDYCSGCHALHELRVNQFLSDIEVNRDNSQQIKVILRRLGLISMDLSHSFQLSMPNHSAEKWFGIVPPDLSFAVTQYGSTWMKIYLKSFYPDPTRPFGCNNTLAPNIVMPNALGTLLTREAPPSLRFRGVGKKEGGYLDEQLVPENIDRALDDLLIFLDYVADPNQVRRHQIGVFVMIFLGLFMLITYRLMRFWHSK